MVVPQVSKLWSCGSFESGVGNVSQASSEPDGAALLQELQDFGELLFVLCQCLLTSTCVIALSARSWNSA